MKKYDLNVKATTLLLIVSLLMIITIYIVGPEAIGDNTFIRMDLPLGIKVIPSLSFVLFSSYFIYSIELLVYKRKDILIISENSIEYSDPFWGKVVIPKSSIKDIYLSTSKNEINITYKDLKLKENIRTKYWKALLKLFFGQTLIYDGVFIIPLRSLKCDNKQEIEAAILELNQDANQARKIVNDKLKEYKIPNINQLIENERVLKECVIEIYNLQQLTQKEIAAMLSIPTYKVSKIIKNYLN